jgi:predicted alpha-1,2-mannosidase
MTTLLISLLALLPLTDYIETRVGTAPSVTHTAGAFGKNTEELGQTLPAVLEPNGMNFWTPQTRDTEKKCVSPYYYKDEKLQGFRNSHWIVGGCTQDYGSMTLMPTFGELVCQPEERASSYNHSTEVSKPYYYSANLERYNLTAEMTGRSRSAIFRFTYDKTGDGYLVVNPNSDEGQGYIEVDTINHLIKGYNPVHRIYQGWGEQAGYSGYFVIDYSQTAITEYGTFRGDTIYNRQNCISGGTKIGAYLKFAVKSGQLVTFKAASSFVSIDGALKNLQAEISHYDFDKTASELKEIWEKRLAIIDVKTDNDADKAKFYSALYRASFLPHAFNDVDGQYPSFSTGMPIQRTQPGCNYYEDYSMWDTYRALHPLINLITPSLGGQMMQSLVEKYKQGGWLPIFPCWNSYTAAMIGDHCIAAISDAYIKGITNFDIQTAYEAMRKNAFTSPDNYNDYKNGMGRRALQSYLNYGYIPLEDSVMEAFHKREQVSRTLEYAYDDYALSQVALALGKTDDYKALSRRANNYRNVIDPSTGYAQARHADGTFLTENNAFSFAKFITEGAPCHYTWYVPHDQYGLMECMGGKDKYIAKLDSMFSERRYWHGNEPCHQVAWLFNYAGQPWKTQQQVRHVMETEYLQAPGGLSGNDDAGQMSAWYIFAAMGFYPVCPATPYYIIGSPSFPELTINLENGKQFKIVARNADSKNIYIQSARLNGKKYNKNYLTHSDIIAGGTLEVVMGDKPNKSWGSSTKSIPPVVFTPQK